MDFIISFAIGLKVKREFGHNENQILNNMCLLFMVTEIANVKRSTNLEK